MRYEYEDRDDSSVGTKLTYLLIGGGIGAVIALLFAPKSGTELREDISVATKKGIEKSKETAALVGEKAGDYYEVTREKANELYSTAQDKAGEIYSTAQEKAGDLSEKARGLTGKAKEAVAGTTNPFTEAIEAGKDAYQEEKQKLSSDSAKPTAPKMEASEEKILELPKDTE